MLVLTPSLYDANLNCKSNHAEAKSRGYMFKSDDWKDVEITGYFRFVSTSGDTRFSMFCRGGEHSKPEPCCTGFKYTNSIHPTRHRFGKEQWHNSYADYRNAKSFSPGSNWFGVKFIVYNVSNGVKLETWMDMGNNNQWSKVNETTDSGGWGDAGRQCGGAADHIGTHGGPTCAFRMDDLGEIRWKKLSVVPITPTGAPPDPGPGPGPGPDPNPTEIVMTTSFLYNVGVTTVATCDEQIVNPVPPPPPPPTGTVTTTKELAFGHSLL